MPDRKYTVVWGEEYFSPRQYQGFKVGPLEVSFTMPSDAEPEEVEKRLRDEHKALEKVGQRMFTYKQRAFLMRLDALPKRT